MKMYKYVSPAKRTFSETVPARVEENALRAPQHEHEMGHTPHESANGGRIVGVRSTKRSV